MPDDSTQLPVPLAGTSAEAEGTKRTGRSPEPCA